MIRAVTRDEGRPAADEVGRQELLRGVAPESVDGLIARCPVVSLAPGEVVLRSGQVNRKLFLLLAGRLTVHLDGPESDPVATLEPGVSVGELSVIDGSPASADVVASVPSRLLAVNEESFWATVRASHEFAANLLVQLAGRMRASNTTTRRLDRASTVDGLTGLRNRRWLEQHLARLVERELRDGRPLSIAMIDLDRFKRFNDEHGHAAGDEALVRVAEAIGDQIRPLDFAARYGGEELVLIFPDTPAAGALAATERVRRVVGSLAIALPRGGTASVSLSAGVAEAGPGEGALDLLARADEALYRAKGEGRDRVVLAPGRDLDDQAGPSRSNGSPPR